MRRVILSDTLDQEPLDIFHSYCGDSVAFRRVINRDWQNSRIIFDGKDIGPGEDPRLFADLDGDIFASYVIWKGDRWQSMLRTRGALAKPRLSAAHVNGKNWSPFCTGRFGYVHSFDPAVVLWPGDARNLEFCAERVASNRSEMGHDGFSVYRGGTNGLYHAGLIVGIGHTTRKAPTLIHRPFLWLFDLREKHIEIRDLDLDYPPEFNLIDPTSLIRTGPNRFEFFTTEVTTDWTDRNARREVAAYEFEL